MNTLTDNLLLLCTPVNTQNMQSAVILIFGVISAALFLMQSIDCKPVHATTTGYESEEEMSVSERKAIFQYAQAIARLALGPYNPHQENKRSNAELINGLLGMNLNKLDSAGRR